MSTENVCVICGITEEKAKERGDIIEGMQIEEERLLGHMKVKLSPGSFLCLECKVRLYNKATDGKLGVDTLKMEAFTSFVGSSAALFGMETALVVQACFNITMVGITKTMPLELSLKILDTMKKVIDKEIDDLYKKAEEKIYKDFKKEGSDKSGLN